MKKDAFHFLYFGIRIHKIFVQTFFLDSLFIRILEYGQSNGPLIRVEFHQSNDFHKRHDPYATPAYTGKHTARLR